MGGAGRTLKVSYGSFACTLEGFEDPVATLRAITEHFQSLSSPERLFAADGPVPGADLLLTAQNAVASGPGQSRPSPPDAPPRDRPGVPDPDADVSRLLSQTNDQMEGAEQRRRLATIGHLKAAVAATVDDPGAGQGGDPARADRYRADLARTVRPPAGRPGLPFVPGVPPVPDRAAPLLLAPELRIPVASAPEIAPPEPVAAPGPDFAAFADRIGATTLPDLMEAAAAFTICAEGAADFTRPDLMRHLSALPDGRGGVPEDQMRSFGSLLRDGRIRRAGQAVFSLAEDAAIMARARRLIG